MYPSVFVPRETFVFVEIFSMRVPGGGGPVSVQRRFEVTEKWQGHMDELPVAPDRDHCGTPYVPADVAYLLVTMGVLKVPEGASFSVQYAARGVYFDTAHAALDYCARRWPREMSLFNDDLRAGVPLELSPSRVKAFAENREKLQPWLDKADALRAQMTPPAEALSK